MFNHLILVCRNTTTKLLEAPWSELAQMFWSTSTISWDIYCSSGETLLQGPNSEACMQIQYLCVSQCALIPPKASLRSHYSMGDVVEMALTVCSNPRAWRGTGNSWLLVDWCCAWDFPTRLGMLFIQPGLWLERVSAPLHTRERKEGGEGARRLAVEVGENFSEGIHCPLAEGTA